MIPCLSSWDMTEVGNMLIIWQCGLWLLFCLPHHGMLHAPRSWESLPCISSCAPLEATRPRPLDPEPSPRSAPWPVRESRSAALVSIGNWEELEHILGEWDKVSRKKMRFLTYALNSLQRMSPPSQLTALAEREVAAVAVCRLLAMHIVFVFVLKFR